MTYDHRTPSAGAVKPFLPAVVAADPRDPPERNRGDWVVRVPLAALDHRKNGGLGHRKLGLLFVLETYCRARAYCWAGDLELAAAFGCKRGALSGLLGELEDDGWIRRVRPPKGQPGRVGILMLKRLDPDLPVASPEGLADVVALLGRVTEGRDRVQETGRDRVQETGRKRRTNSKEDENVTFARAGGGEPDPEAVPPPIEAPAPVAVEARRGPLARPAPPEAWNSDPVPAEGTTAAPGVETPAPEAEDDPTPAPEQVEADGEQELRLVLDEFEGHPYLALRVWARAQGGTWFPCKGKGVSIRLSEAEGLADALREALDRVSPRPDDPVATGRRAR